MDNFEELFGRIILDFDRKAGHYAGLNYTSPYVIVREDIASRSGHSVEEIRAAITRERICRATSRKLDSESKGIYDDWISAYKVSLEEIGYRPLPTNLYGTDSKFHNTKFLKEYCTDRFRKLGCYEIDVDNNVEVLSFGAYIHENPETSLAIRFEIVKKYGGTMRASTVFRRHTPGMKGASSSRRLDIAFNMMGKLIFHDLRMNTPPEFEPIAEHDGTDIPNIDKILAIIERTVLYYFEPR
jgi:hypothetical protein